MYSVLNPVDIAYVNALIQRASAAATQAFRQRNAKTAKASPGDYLSPLDTANERLIAQGLMERFPLDGVYGEEGGNYAEGEPTWIIDPLDGTGNFLAGLPLFGVTVSRCRQGVPQYSWISQGLTGSTLTVVSSHSVTDQSGAAVTLPAPPPKLGTAALWLGYPENASSPFPQLIRDAIRREGAFRILENWCPVADLFSVVAGGLDCIVGYNCRGTELPAVLHTLAGLGLRVETFGSDAVLGLGDAASFVISPENIHEDIARAVSPLLRQDRPPLS